MRTELISLNYFVIDFGDLDLEVNTKLVQAIPS